MPPHPDRVRRHYDETGPMTPEPPVMAHTHQWQHDFVLDDWLCLTCGQRISRPEQHDGGRSPQHG